MPPQDDSFGAPNILPPSPPTANFSHPPAPSDLPEPPLPPPVANGIPDYPVNIPPPPPPVDTNAAFPPPIANNIPPPPPPTSSPPPPTSGSAPPPPPPPPPPTDAGKRLCFSTKKKTVFSL